MAQPGHLETELRFEASVLSTCFVFTKGNNELIADFSGEEFTTLSKSGESAKPKTTRYVGLVWKNNSLTKRPSQHPNVFHHQSAEAPKPCPDPPQTQTGSY